jgi:hypothetical protein
MAVVALWGLDFLLRVVILFTRLESALIVKHIKRRHAVGCILGNERDLVWSHTQERTDRRIPDRRQNSEEKSVTANLPYRRRDL